MSLGIYDISQPSGHGRGENVTMTPYIPGNHPVPKHAKSAPFDPSRVTLEGNANYLGSRKLRASKDEKHVKVRELLDQDAVINGCKVWHRETEYMNTGNVRLGPMSDSKKYRYHELFPSPSVPPAPALMHLDSSDSVSSTSSTSTDVNSARAAIDENMIVFGASTVSETCRK